MDTREPERVGSGNLSSALEDAIGDDFLTGGDITIDQIHNLSSELRVLAPGHLHRECHPCKPYARILHP